MESEWNQNRIGIKSESNRNRIGIESESNWSQNGIETTELIQNQLGIDSELTKN